MKKISGVLLIGIAISMTGCATSSPPPQATPAKTVSQVNQTPLDANPDSDLIHSSPLFKKLILLYLRLQMQE